MDRLHGKKRKLAELYAVKFGRDLASLSSGDEQDDIWTQHLITGCAG